MSSARTGSVRRALSVRTQSPSTTRTCRLDPNSLLLAINPNPGGRRKSTPAREFCTRTRAIRIRCCGWRLQISMHVHLRTCLQRSARVCSLIRQRTRPYRHFHGTSRRTPPLRFVSAPLLRPIHRADTRAGTCCTGTLLVASDRHITPHVRCARRLHSTPRC